MRILLSAAILAACILFPAHARTASAATPPDLRTLTGRVTDTAGTPLSDVRIAVLEANRFTETGLEGEYAISDLPNGTYGISFSRIGYAPEVRRITISDRDLTLDVAMRRTLIELPPVQVTAAPFATTSLDAPQPTSVLAGTDLEAARSATLGETLDGLAGVRNYSTGQGIGKPVIRGLTSNRVLVLADGQRVESQQWGDEHGPSVETANAERIEVIRGPASVLYGSDAIGGVINVVERPLPDANGEAPFVRGRASAAVATNGDAPDGSLELEGASGALGFRGAFTGRRSDDLETPSSVLVNSGYRALGGNGAVGLRGDWGAVKASYGYRDERVEIHEDPAEEPGATPFQRIANHRGQVVVNLPVGLARLQVDAGFERNRRREFEEHDADDVALGLVSESYTANAHFHHAPLGPLGGIVGVSFLRNDVSKFGEETLVPNSSSDDLGVYLFEQTELDRWSFSFGARYDRRTLDVEDDAALGVTAQTRTYNSVTGNVGALYRLAEPLALVLNVGRGFRAPTPFDLFANGVHEGTLRFERGSPDLVNETSLNTDLALRVQTERLSMEIGGFVNLIDGYIHPDPTGVEDPESGLQIYDIIQGDARLTGVEASAQYHLSEAVHFNATADYTRGQNTSRGVPLAFVPPFRTTYSVRVEGDDRGWLHVPHLELGGETNARQTRADPEDFAPDGYTLFNLSGGFSVPVGGTELVLDATVRNLFDRDYRSFLSRYKTFASDPGRNLIVRVSTEF